MIHVDEPVPQVVYEGPNRKSDVLWYRVRVTHENAFAHANMDGVSADAATRRQFSRFHPRHVMQTHKKDNVTIKFWY